MSDFVNNNPEARFDTLTEFARKTPARVLVGRCGSAVPTRNLLELRADHAAALDAVRSEFQSMRDFGAEFCKRFELFEVRTQARTKLEYLQRPDLGRVLDPYCGDSLRTLTRRGVDFQVVIGDGLSSMAVASQVPNLLPLLEEGAQSRGWSFGRPFVVKHCRVGVMNDIGRLLEPSVIVLLIGERPGLATARSLSAYMGYQPRPGLTDADRNLISNIHEGGVDPQAAACRILTLASEMLRLHTSGIALKEAGPVATLPPARDATTQVYRL
jgi:ethanolamine ammonia-lyase small subunit